MASPKQHAQTVSDSRVRVCVCVCAHAHAQSLSHVWLFATPWTVAHEAPLSMGFSHFLLQGLFPTQGSNP